MGWLSGIISIVANFLGWGREIDQRKNTPEMIANAKAKEDQRRMEVIAALDAQTENPDPRIAQKALDELRKLTSEE